MLSVLILTSMVSLYYYLNIFINRVVCLAAGSFSVYDGLIINSHLILLIIGVIALNWLGGLPLFLVCGNMVV